MWIYLPLNGLKYPKFNSYLTFKNGKECNLSNQFFSQDFPMQGRNQRQISNKLIVILLMQQNLLAFWR